MHHLWGLVELMGLGVILSTPFLLIRLSGAYAICTIVAEFFFFPPTHKLVVYGISYFTLLLIAQNIGLLYKIIFQRRYYLLQAEMSAKQQSVSIAEKSIIVLTIIMLLTQLTEQLLNGFTFEYVNSNVFIGNYTQVISGLIFFAGCVVLLHERQDFEKIFWVVIVCALVLSIETVLTFYVPAVQHSIGRFTINRGGSFISVFLEDGVAVALWAAVGFIFSGYFFFLYPRRRWLAVICMLIVILPVVLDIKRSVLFSLLAALFLFVAFCRAKIWWRLTCFLVALLTIIFVISNISFKYSGRDPEILAQYLALYSSFERDNSASQVKKPADAMVKFASVKTKPASTKVFKQQVQVSSVQQKAASLYHVNISREKPVNYFRRRIKVIYSPISTLIRVGQAIRGWQVESYFFPWGAGPGLMRYFLYSSAVPLMGPDALFLFKRFPYIWEGYMRVAAKEVVTDAQIGYLSFYYSFGLLGAVLEILVILLIIISLIRTFFFTKPNTVDYYFCLGIAGTLVLYSFYYAFNTGPLIYVLFMVLLRAVFAQKNWVSAQEFNKSKPVLTHQ